MLSRSTKLEAESGDNRRIIANVNTYSSKGNKDKGGALKAAPILSNAKSGLYGIWMFTLFWNVVSWPILIAAREVLINQFQHGDLLSLLALLFPMVGIVCLAVAVKRLIAWRRFGETPLFLNPFPGSIGGHVAGTICLPGSIPKDIRYDVSLVCVYTYETRDSDNKHRSAERMIWQHSQAAQLRRGMDRGRDSMNLLFRFDVPEGLPRSESKSGNYHHWRLHVHAEMDGVDLDRSFDIPVHPTSEQTTLGLKQNSRKKSNQYLEQLTSIMRVEVGPDLLHMVFPQGRRKSFGAVMVAAGILLLMLGFFMLKLGGQEQGEFVLTFAGLICLLVSAPVILFGLYVPCNTLDVNIAKDSITVRRVVLGVGLYRKKVAMSQLKQVVLDESMRSQVNGLYTVTYRVLALGRNKEKLVLAEGLKGKPLAEEALHFIRANGNLVV